MAIVASPVMTTSVRPVVAEWPEMEPGYYRFTFSSGEHVDGFYLGVIADCFEVDTGDSIGPHHLLRWALVGVESLSICGECSESFISNSDYLCGKCR